MKDVKHSKVTVFRHSVRSQHGTSENSGVKGCNNLMVDKTWIPPCALSIEKMCVVIRQRCNITTFGISKRFYLVIQLFTIMHHMMAALFWPRPSNCLSVPLFSTLTQEHIISILKKIPNMAQCLKGKTFGEGWKWVTHCTSWCVVTQQQQTKYKLSELSFSISWD